MRRVILLGSTGSIGVQTLDVIGHLNDLHAADRWPVRFDVVGLAAGSNEQLLRQQADRFCVRDLALAGARSTGGVRSGDDSALRLVREVEADLVVAAMVGAAGLPATLEAVRIGRDVALANKETLVAAGALVVAEARRSGARLLPIDSEHSGVWQCLQALPSEGSSPGGVDDPGHRAIAPPLLAPPIVERVILTASGGPFRTWPKERIERATVEEALAHPTWEMGRKVTIDSASLMNKALELIEAHWLFGLEPGRIGAIVHPQSVVHCLVEFIDGAVIAQLGAPDMRAPIKYALSFPNRAPARADRLDWSALAQLEFAPPDTDRFPALKLAYDAIEAGGTAGAVLNAANEAAVEAFLAGAIAFGRITDLVVQAMSAVAPRPIAALEDVLDADAAARDFVARATG